MAALWLWECIQVSIDTNPRIWMRNVFTMGPFLRELSLSLSLFFAPCSQLRLLIACSLVCTKSARRVKGFEVEVIVFCSSAPCLWCCCPGSALHTQQFRWFRTPNWLYLLIEWSRFSFTWLAYTCCFAVRLQLAFVQMCLLYYTPFECAILANTLYLSKKKTMVFVCVIVRPNITYAHKSTWIFPSAESIRTIGLVIDVYRLYGRQKDNGEGNDLCIFPCKTNSLRWISAMFFAPH